ncbi:hypothetical protein [Staphylococcus cohnii]
MGSYISNQIDDFIRNNEINLKFLNDKGKDKEKNKKLYFKLVYIKNDVLSFDDLSEINKREIEKFLKEHTDFSKKKYKLSFPFLICLQFVALFLIVMALNILIPKSLTQNFFGTFRIITVIFYIIYCAVYDFFIRHEKLNENFNETQSFVLNFALTISFFMYLYFSYIIMDAYSNRQEEYYNIITVVSLIIVVFFQWSFPEMIKFILTSKENNNSVKNIELSNRVQEKYVLINWLSTFIIGLIVIITFGIKYFCK